MGMQLGYTMMTEQAGPRDLVAHVVAAEAAGFAFAVSSDHFFPWLDEQGHSPNAWVTLGAVAQATSRIDLMTYVTCPTFRYTPPVVAQKAATLQVLAGGRFTLGLGSGENLNEHVVGEGWPGVLERQEMLAVAGDRGIETLAPLADHLVGVEPEAELIRTWNAVDGAPQVGQGARAIGQVPICW